MADLSEAPRSNGSSAVECAAWWKMVESHQAGACLCMPRRWAEEMPGILGHKNRKDELGVVLGSIKR